MLSSALMITAPILIAAVAGMICERSGVINIALEGLMLIGAMTAAVVHVLLETKIGFSVPLALVIAAFAGCLFSAIHAFASVTLKADQIISGIGINMLTIGVTMFICQLIFRMDRTPSYRMGMRSIPGGIYPTIWIALVILVISWFMIYKRPWGLRLRAAGEHPQAAISAGINVDALRYAAVLISGLLAGLAGCCLVLTQDIQFTSNAINGKGFIALAAVSFGRRLPLGLFGASLLFGFSASFAVNIVNIKVFQFLPSEAFNMIPYVITLLTLIFYSRRQSQKTS